MTPAYQGGSQTTVDPAAIAQAVSTRATAQAIVQENAGKSNYEKLSAYRGAVCGLTDYDFDALDEINNKTYIYGNPSQAVYVFDGDPNTKVVCEGYSKAFKYLCDLSDFDGDVRCFLVEGNVNGEGHMWNVVRMEDGNYYLTDLTLYDNPAYEGKIPLLARMNEDAESYNYMRTIYNYQQDAAGRYLYADLYTNGYLPLCPTPYQPGHAVTTPPTTPAEPARPSFVDVASSAYYADAVAWAVAQNITTGATATTFSPGVTCNRAQILTFLWRAAGSPTPTAGNPFSDLRATDYYYNAALWAYEHGMVSGPNFGATTPCTRASTVEYLWKAAGSPASSYTGSFTDVPAGSDYAQAVAWAVAGGVTTGTSNTTFSPAATCTRGQIVTFLHRSMGA